MIIARLANSVMGVAGCSYSSDLIENNQFRLM